RDSLDAALAAAGHDATRATTWVWEGVVMYLHRVDIEATLAVVTRRSAGGSRLILNYLAPPNQMPPTIWILCVLLKRVGVPFPALTEPDAMRALLAQHGFDVVREDGIPALGAALAEDIGREIRFLTHIRIVVADRGRVSR